MDKRDQEPTCLDHGVCGKCRDRRDTRLSGRCRVLHRCLHTCDGERRGNFGGGYRTGTRVPPLLVSFPCAGATWGFGGIPRRAWCVTRGAAAGTKGLRMRGRRSPRTAESALAAWPHEIRELRRLGRPKKTRNLQQKLVRLKELTEGDDVSVYMSVYDSLSPRRSSPSLDTKGGGMRGNRTATASFEAANRF